MCFWLWSGKVGKGGKESRSWFACLGLFLPGGECCIVQRTYTQQYCKPSVNYNDNGSVSRTPAELKEPLERTTGDVCPRPQLVLLNYPELLQWPLERFASHFRGPESLNAQIVCASVRVRVEACTPLLHPTKASGTDTAGTEAQGTEKGVVAYFAGPSQPEL